MLKAATYHSTPCKHCGGTERYLSARTCVNVRTPGHSEMVYVPPAVTEQACRICSEVKPLNEYEERADSGRRRTECKDCRATTEVARRYSITVPEVHALYESAGNRCQICGTDGKDHATFKRLVVDHDHATGEVRGLLCANCNSGLGQFKDSPRLLEAAHKYLEANS